MKCFEKKKIVEFISATDYKNLTWVWGADRKFCHEADCLASQGKTMIPRDRIFYPHWTLMFDSFSCISFDFKGFILKVAFITAYNGSDIGNVFKNDVTGMTST